MVAVPAFAVSPKVVCPPRPKTVEPPTLVMLLLAAVELFVNCVAPPLPARVMICCSLPLKLGIDRKLRSTS